MNRFGSIAAIALAFGAGPALASDVDLESDFARDIFRMAASGQGLDEIKGALREVFARQDIDGTPGLSAADAAALAARYSSELHAQIISDWMRYDTDGDFTVTVDELRPAALAEADRPLISGTVEVEPTADQIAFVAEALISERMARDLDGDGAVTFEELTRYAEAAAASRLAVSQAERLLPPPELDADADGTISAAEYIAGAEEIFAALDADGDGAVSRQDRALLRSQQRREALRSSKEAETRDDTDRRAAALERALQRRGLQSCSLPDLPTFADTYVLAGLKGAGLSSLHLDNPAEAAEVIDVTVPPGDTPVTLIASFAGDTILRLDGAGNRVETVVATGGQIGVAGAGVVTFVTADPDCHIDLAAPTPADPRRLYDTPLAGTVIGATLGTVDLGVGSNQDLTQLAGAVGFAGDGAAQAAWDRFAGTNPGGLILLSADDVVAAGPVGKLPVAPQSAGIAQLVAEGVLLPVESQMSPQTVLEGENGAIVVGGQVYTPRPGTEAILAEGLIFTEERERIWVGRPPAEYRVTAPFAFPAELTGAHTVTFLLPGDMAAPTGDPGDSQVRRIGG
ncbi:MAG: hypothetical protein AAF771_09885 [Pseudomonadota bacterium]